MSGAVHTLQVLVHRSASPHSGAAPPYHTRDGGRDAPVVCVEGERRDVSNLSPGTKKMATHASLHSCQKLSKLFVHIFVL